MSSSNDGPCPNQSRNSNNLSAATTPITVPSSSNHSRKRTHDSEISSYDMSPPGDDVDMTKESHIDRARTPDISPVQDDFIQLMASIDILVGGPSLNVGPTNEHLGSLLADKLGEDTTPTVVQTPVPALEEAAQAAPRNVRRRLEPNIGNFSCSGTGGTSNTRRDSPMIDAATRQLGVGWNMMSRSPEELATARGTTKFIDRHFPVSNPEMIAQNRSQDSQFVKAVDGFYLFQDRTRSARLLSTEIEDAMARLRKSPIDFMGAEPLVWAESSGTTRNNGSEALDVNEPLGLMDTQPLIHADALGPNHISGNEATPFGVLGKQPVPHAEGSGAAHFSFSAASDLRPRTASDASHVDGSKVRPEVRKGSDAGRLSNTSRLNLDNWEDEDTIQETEGGREASEEVAGAMEMDE